MNPSSDNSPSHTTITNLIHQQQQQQQPIVTQLAQVITFEELSQYFHLPINEVSKELGVCATVLKKICRRNGIPRWPHRKVYQSLERVLNDYTSPIEEIGLSGRWKNMGQRKRVLLSHSLPLTQLTFSSKKAVGSTTNSWSNSLLFLICSLL